MKLALLIRCKRACPVFVDACNAEVDEVILDQGAFAADYQDDEYKLLGMAIKYAGLRHKHVRVIARRNG